MHHINFFYLSKSALKIALWVCLFILCGCFSKHKEVLITQKDLVDYHKLRHMSAPVEKKKKGKMDPKKEAENSIRYQAVQETALSLGAQAGLAVRSKEINAMLEAKSRSLDIAFSFEKFMLPHRVISPVLAESKNQYHVADHDTIRFADHAYVILAQATFATNPPHWRQYLIMKYKAPTAAPNVTLLPKNSKEKALWMKFIEIGWKEGVAQANRIYDRNLSRLSRDYRGMILYQQLLSKNMVSLPYVSISHLGITGNADHLNINDRVLRITALPQLNVHAESWKPVVIKPNTRSLGD